MVLIKYEKYCKAVRECCTEHTTEFRNQPNINEHLECEEGLTTGKIKLDLYWCHLPIFV